MAKKFLTFLIFALVGLATFLAGYLFSRQPIAENTDQQALINNSLISRFEKSPEKYGPPVGVFSLSEGGADFLAISTSGKELIYYAPRSGEIRSVNLQNSLASSTLITKIQSGAQKISWASNKTLVAVYQDGGIYYDLNSGFSKKLGPKIKSPALSKSGDKLAYEYVDDKEGTIEIRVSDPKLEAYKKVMSAGFENYQIDWLTDNTLSLIKPPSQGSSMYWLFTLNTESGWFNKVLDTKTSLEALWSPDGRKLIYSDSNRSTPMIHFVDMSTGQETDLNMKTTAFRCVWSIDNKTVYCAASDSFVVLDASSTNITPRNIFDSSLNNISSAAASTANLFLSSAEDYFIFRNYQDGRLYGLHLNQ